MALKYDFACIVVTNAVKNNLLILAKAIDFEADGMWIAPLSPTGILPATRWMSNGYTPKKLLEGMADPVKMYNFAKATYDANQQVFPFTQLQVTNALANCTVTDGTFDSGSGPQPESPWQLAARLGLQFIQGAP